MMPSPAESAAFDDPGVVTVAWWGGVLAPIGCLLVLLACRAFGGGAWFFFLGVMFNPFFVPAFGFPVAVVAGAAGSGSRRRMVGVLLGAVGAAAAVASFAAAGILGALLNPLTYLLIVGARMDVGAARAALEPDPAPADDPPRRLVAKNFPADGEPTARPVLETTARVRPAPLPVEPPAPVPPPPRVVALPACDEGASPLAPRHGWRTAGIAAVAAVAASAVTAIVVSANRPPAPPPALPTAPEPLAAPLAAQDFARSDDPLAPDEVRVLALRTAAGVLVAIAYPRDPDLSGTIEHLGLYDGDDRYYRLPVTTRETTPTHGLVVAGITLPPPPGPVSVGVVPPDSAADGPAGIFQTLPADAFAPLAAGETERPVRLPPAEILSRDELTGISRDPEIEPTARSGPGREPAAVPPPAAPPTAKSEPADSPAASVDPPRSTDNLPPPGEDEPAGRLPRVDAGLWRDGVILALVLPDGPDNHYPVDELVAVTRWADGTVGEAERYRVVRGDGEVTVGFILPAPPDGAVRVWFYGPPDRPAVEQVVPAWMFSRGGDRPFRPVDELPDPTIRPAATHN